MQIILVLVLIIGFIYFLRRELTDRFSEKSFLAIVNHTFRTPLTRIKWMSDSLTVEHSLEKQAEISRNISSSIDKVLQIVDLLAGIKDIHSQASYDLKAVSLREILEHAIGTYRQPLNDKKIAFSMPSLGHMPLLTLDTKKISFVIDALLENAIWYSKENGTITITGEVKNKSIILSVTDTGIGLSYKDRWALFSRFYRSEQAKKMNTDGMGLSLYLAKEIIRRHKGSLRATSKGVDRGSTFTITLPIT